MFTDLSWFIYWADIVHGLGTVGGLIGGLGLCAFLFIYFAGPDSYKEDYHFKTHAAIVVVGLMIGIFTPSRNTIMLIAASELTYIAANTDTGEIVIDKSFKALERFLDGYIDVPEVLKND